MKRRSLLLSLIAAPAALRFIPAVLAQEQSTPSNNAFPAINELEGIQAAISRIYGPDIQGMLEATPDLSPEETVPEISTASIEVFAFDAADNAAAAFAEFRTTIADQLTLLSQAGTPTVTIEDDLDVADSAAEATLTTDTDGYVTWYRYVLIHDDTYLFRTSALVTVEAQADLANDLASYIVNEGDSEGNEALFVADGRSSGGLWGFMPPNDDPLLRGLIAIADTSLLPPPGG